MAQFLCSIFFFFGFLVDSPKLRIFVSYINIYIYIILLYQCLPQYWYLDQRLLDFFLRWINTSLKHHDDRSNLQSRGTKAMGGTKSAWKSIHLFGISFKAWISKKTSAQFFCSHIFLWSHIFWKTAQHTNLHLPPTNQRKNKLSKGECEPRAEDGAIRKSHRQLYRSLCKSHAVHGGQKKGKLESKKGHLKLCLFKHQVICSFQIHGNVLPNWKSVPSKQGVTG